MVRRRRFLGAEVLEQRRIVESGRSVDFYSPCPAGAYPSPRPRCARSTLSRKGRGYGAWRSHRRYIGSSRSRPRSAPRRRGRRAMLARAHPKRALRPFLPADAPLLAEIFRASVAELTGDDYSAGQQEAWASMADDETAFAARLANALTLLGTI